MVSKAIGEGSNPSDPARVCPVCGSLFKRSVRAKFCSPECNSRAQYSRYKKMREEIREKHRLPLLNPRKAERERLRRLQKKMERMEMQVDSTSDERIVNNVVRHEYRVLSEDEKAQMKTVKDAALAFINAIEAIEPCRERSTAVTRAEEACMWAVKAITK